jgi:hypothetical protein
MHCMTGITAGEIIGWGIVLVVAGVWAVVACAGNNIRPL